MNTARSAKLFKGMDQVRSNLGIERDTSENIFKDMPGYSNFSDEREYFQTVGNLVDDLQGLVNEERRKELQRKQTIYFGEWDSTKRIEKADYELKNTFYHEVMEVLVIAKNVYGELDERDEPLAEEFEELYGKLILEDQE